jgi:hypothetical protein
VSQTPATFGKDREEIVKKFARLLERLRTAPGPDESAEGAMAYFEVKTSALNLFARTAGDKSVYYRELSAFGGDESIVNRSIMMGILNAAMVDYREGFMADTKLLVSAEVLADFLTQAEVLLEHDYKDAAAVVVRAVLEDGLRRVCISKGVAVKDRDGVHQLAEALMKQNCLTAVQYKEIEAKKEIGNKAAHGKFNEYTKADVVAFHEFVQRLLATLI